MSDSEVEIMAEAIHNVWVEGKIRDGWMYSPITDKDSKRHSCLVLYSDLSEADKDSDRDLARSIPTILEKAAALGRLSKTSAHRLDDGGLQCEN